MGGAILRYVESCRIAEHDGLKVGVVKFTETMEVLSSAVVNGGSSEADALFIMQVPHDYSHSDPVAHACSVRDALGLPANSVGMMTAAEVGYVFNVQEEEYGGSSAVAVATAGLSNHVVAGDVLEDWESRHLVSLARAAKMMAGTINIAVIADVPLTDAAKVNLFMPLVEGKSAAMADRGFRETGTTSDSMAVICPKRGVRAEYAGTGSSLGIAAARAVRAAVGYALNVRLERPVPEEPMKLLEKMGYDATAMWTLSGSPMDEEEYKSALARYLEGDRVKTFLDLITFISDRADALIDDGNPAVVPMLSDICDQLAGITPEFGHGTVQGVVTAMAEAAGRLHK
ncbi:MAG: adenosylcobinamide amidohydrolase [Candidatus Methanomethylophilaceae archaeon]|nr:adenosylcobinamide amidohydrolase [Candidatus Methanomethylophilaceae archaeon]